MGITTQSKTYKHKQEIKVTHIIGTRLK